MPLPDGWNGIFYSAETGGDMLFDLLPEDFARVAEDSGDDPAFLFAGAHFDLRLQGDERRAEDFLRVGKDRWPAAPWSAYEMLVETMLPDVRRRRDDEHDLAVSNAVSYLFTGATVNVL